MKIYTKENHENLSTLALVNLITISLTVISVISVILFAANSIWKEKLDSTLVGMPHTFETRETGRETGSAGGPYLPYPNTDPAALPGSNLLDSVDRVLASMKWATIAFNAPERINLKDRAQIQLLLSLQKSMDELRSEIVAAGRREGEKIQVSNQMEAHLSSQEGSFNIVKIAQKSKLLAQ